MCRFIVALGTFEINQVVDGMIMMAKDRTLDHELNKEQGRESWLHDDGWGVAYIENGEWKIYKSIKPIFEDPFVETLKTIKTHYMLIHVRKKMGSELANENTHPFTTIHKEQEFVFCHNGFIDENIEFNNSFTPIGKTDSEQLFYSILSCMEKEDFPNCIRGSFSQFSKFTGTNIALSTKDKTVIATRKNLYPTYYQMVFSQEEDSLVVSSEPLVTMALTKWQKIGFGKILQINNITQEITLEAEILAPQNPSLQES